MKALIQEKVLLFEEIDVKRKEEITALKEELKVNRLQN